MGRGRCGGSALVLCGAFLFASANAIAKALYDRDLNLVTLFVLRGAIIYCLNGAAVALHSGGAAARRVLTLRAGSRRLARLALTRSVIGLLAIAMLNLSYQIITLADAFALSLATMTTLTLALAPLAIGGSAEMASRGSLCGAAFALAGIVFVTQPSAIFGSTPPSATGVALGIGAGASFACFNLLTRLLGRAAPPTAERSTSDTAAVDNADRHPHAHAPLSPSLLLSYYMAVISLGALGVAVAAAIGTAAHIDVPRQATFALHPLDELGAFTGWTLVILYCAAIMGSQLAFAAGIGRIPAGRASILSLTELSFSWALDVFVLREPTDALSIAGILAIFVGGAVATNPAGAADAGWRMLSCSGSSRRAGGRGDAPSLAGLDAASEPDPGDWEPRPSAPAGPRAPA